MDSQVVLLLICVAHTIAATSNGSNPRSFAVFRQTETSTYEPIDFPEGEISSEISQRRIKLAERRNTRCNSSNHNPALCNKTAPTETLHVSEKVKTFLKGPLAMGFIPSVYTLVFIVSVPLNGMAFLAFSCQICKKKSVVVYMSQLALADLLFGLLLPLKVHYYARGSDWVFGEAACRVVTTAFYGYMYCSVLLLMCMSVDRMLAVAYPMTTLHWRKPQYAALVCAGAWILSLVCAMPLLTIQQTMPITQVGMTCHDALEPTDPLYVKLFASISSFLFVVPLVVTVTCYSIILRTLRNKSPPQGALASSSLSRKRRKRATIMVISMVVEFVVCFAPTNIILLLHCIFLGTNYETTRADEIYATYMVATCVGSVSACLDPLLYYFGSSQCRQQISTTMWWRRGKGAAMAPHSHLSTPSGASCQYSRPCTMRTPIKVSQLE